MISVISSALTPVAVIVLGILYELKNTALSGDHVFMSMMD